MWIKIRIGLNFLQIILIILKFIQKFRFIIFFTSLSTFLQNKVFFPEKFHDLKIEHY